MSGTVEVDLEDRGLGPEFHTSLGTLVVRRGCECIQMPLSPCSSVTKWLMLPLLCDL